MIRTILTFFLLIMLASVATAQHQKQTHSSKHQSAHHKKVIKTHKKKKQLHARVYHPQCAAPSEEKLNMVLPTAQAPTGLAGLFTRHVASVEDRIVKFVHNTVSNLHYSKYKMGGGHFELAKGVYILDCSDYVDNVLHRADPKAYSSLVNFTGTDRPTTQHYYDFFTELGDDNMEHGWSKIDNVGELLPGDILVFRYKRGMRATGGHVMIVMDKPIGDDNIYLVRVADSAASGHSHDTREPNTSGIGIGTLLLKADEVSGHPTAFAWKVGAPWKSNVRIAMGRPIYS